MVIGETTEVGDNVTLYQGVTLGGTGKETGKRHPTLGDNVVVGAGAQLLGSIKVGDNARIGAGSVVVHDVPRDSTVVGNPGHPVLLDGQRVGIPDIDYTHLPDPVAEAMRCLVRRIVELENELDDLYPERKEKRRAKTAYRRAAHRGVHRRVLRRGRHLKAPAVGEARGPIGGQALAAAASRSSLRGMLRFDDSPPA